MNISMVAVLLLLAMILEMALSCGNGLYLSPVDLGLENGVSDIALFGREKWVP